MCCMWQLEANGQKTYYMGNMRLSLHCPKVYSRCLFHFQKEPNPSCWVGLSRWVFWVCWACWTLWTYWLSFVGICDELPVWLWCWVYLLVLCLQVIPKEALDLWVYIKLTESWIPASIIVRKPDSHTWFALITREGDFQSEPPKIKLQETTHSELRPRNMWCVVPLLVINAFETISPLEFCLGELTFTRRIDA